MKLNEIPIHNLTSKETDVLDSEVFVPDRVSALLKGSKISVSSNSSINNDTSIYLGGRDKNRFKFGFKAGSEYTLIATISIDEELSGQIIKDALTVTAIPVVNGGPLWGYSVSNSAPNIKGIYTLVVDFKIPKDANALWIRLSSGMLKNSGKVSWDNISYIEKNSNNGLMSNLKNYLSGGRLKNLVSIKNFEVTVDKSLIPEYSISELKQDELEEITDFVGYEIINITEVRDAQAYLKDFTKNSINNIPKMVKDIFDKYTFDYHYFFNTHPSNAFQRFRTLIWLINNFENIKNVDNNNGFKSNLDYPKYMFTYWNDGFQNSPGIVQAAHDHLNDSLNKIRGIYLNDENIDFYIDVPEYMKKLKNKSVAHLSDFYRVALLRRYGGAWIDSTVMVGNDFENRLINLFLKNKDSVVTPRYGSDNVLQTTQGISNWFIAVAENHNRLISLQYNSILLWMKDHNEFSYYYMFHALWDFLICLDEQSRKEWKNSEYVSAYKSHTIQKNMFSPVNSKFIDIMESNLVNKLTYKYDKAKNSSDSILSYIGRNKIL